MRGQQMLPRTIDGMKHVCYFRHALALDGRRVKFLPEYAYGGTTYRTSEDPDKLDNNNSWLASESEFEKGSSGNAPPTSNKNAVGRSQTSRESTRDRPQTLEVWFAGTHSDM